jgi:hypothetical protein
MPFRKLKLFLLFVILFYFIISCKKEFDPIQNILTENAPTIIYPENNSKNIENHPILRWNCDGAISFNIALDTIPNPRLIVAQNITVDSFKIENLKNDKIYYWKVIAKFANGLSIPSEIYNFETTKYSVVLCHPTNDSSLIYLNTTLLWKCEEALYFNVILDTITPPKSVIAQSLTEDSLKIENLKINKTYYWQVVANFAGGFSVSSKVSQFHVFEHSAPILLLGPSNNSSFWDSQTSLYWKCYGALNYNVYLDTIAPPNVMVAQSIIADSIKIENLIKNKPYYWQVTAVFPSGSMVSSEVWQFKRIAILPLTVSDLHLDWPEVNLEIEDFIMESSGSGTSWRRDTSVISVKYLVNPFNLPDSNKTITKINDTIYFEISIENSYSYGYTKNDIVVSIYMDTLSKNIDLFYNYSFFGRYNYDIGIADDDTYFNYHMRDLPYNIDNQNRAITTIPPYLIMNYLVDLYYEYKYSFHDMYGSIYINHTLLQVLGFEPNPNLNIIIYP